MGADLYLSSVLETCFARYGRAHHLAADLLRLVRGDTRQALQDEGQHLKEALTLHAQQVGSMSPALFDLVAEIADLAQGEDAVARLALAEQIAALIDLFEQDGSAEAVDLLGASGPACLAHDLLDFLKGRQEIALPRGAAWLAQRLAMLAQRESENTLLSRLAQLSQSMRAVLEQKPTHALTHLVQERLLPSLEHVCLKQSECLRELSEALEPLATEDATFAPGQALAHWRTLTARMLAVTEGLRVVLVATLQTPEDASETIAQHLMGAWTHLQERWEEAESLQPELQSAMNTLSSLLVRTLPTLAGLQKNAEAAEESEEPEESPQAPIVPISSPLRRVVGTLLRHQELCQETLQVVGRYAYVARCALVGESRPALLELGSTMVGLLYAEEHGEPGEETDAPISQMLAASTAQQVALAPGVVLLPGSQMDLCYAQIQAAAHHAQRQSAVREWVEQALSDPLTTRRLVLGFWRLVLGEPILWMGLLIELLQETLQSHMTPASTHAQVLALLEQLHALLQGEPGPRLQALLTDLQAQLAPDSPLASVAERLRLLTQGQTRVHLDAAWTLFSSEIQQHLDWPEEERGDLNWLLDLVRHLWETPAERHPALLLTLLPQILTELAEGEAEAWGTRLVQALAATPLDEIPLPAILQVLEALPEKGPQPPRADLRQASCWRGRLVRTLLRKQVRLNEERHADHDAHVAVSPLVEQVMQVITQILRAWLFPPEGYFRDPYTDLSALWVAAGVCWPTIAEQIAERIDAPDPQSTPWLAEEGLIPAQIPLDAVHALSELVQSRTPHFPSREHLTRWGQVIRLEEDGPYSLSAWHTYLVQRRQALLLFLNEALARQEPILCSL